MRVGEILLERGWVAWDSLALALAEQPRVGLRLCSLLIARGALAFDHASRALGERLGVAAVLRRHLERRDPRLAARLPAELARAAIALPIGRMGNGALIVCVRDPSPKLERALRDALGEPVLLAVAPARYLERLVMAAYAPRPSESIDFEITVDDAAAVADAFDIDVDLGADAGSVADPFDIPVEVEPPDADEPAGVILAAAPARPPASRALPVEIRSIASPASPAAPPPATSLERTIASLADIDDLGWLFDVVMAFVATRWSAALLFSIDGEVASGLRGQGAALTDEVARGLSLPLSAPTIVQAAREQRRPVDAGPRDAGEGQAHLHAHLGAPRQLAAAPLLRVGAVAQVLVVGDPRGDDPEDAIVDLARLVEAIDEAQARLA